MLRTTEPEGFRTKTRLYKVYHIKIKGSNMGLHEGYVGITRRSLSYRLTQHMHSKRPVGRILRSISKENIEIEEIIRLPKEDALELEYRLRPERNMGWNVMAGGNASTVKCPECGKPLPKRKTGSYCEKCRPSKFVKGHTPHNTGKGERYKLTSPDGTVYFPDIFTVFCREHGLTPQNLRKVAKGKRKHHNGWTAERIDGR